MSNDTTLPWTGSIHTEAQPGTASSQPEARWFLQGAKPKSLATSMLCLGPAESTESRLHIGGDGVAAPLSSTPRGPGWERWSVVDKEMGLASLPLLQTRPCS